MKYLCLIYSPESALQSMPKADVDAMVAEYVAFSDAIKKSGHFVGGNRLQPIDTATTVRIRDGKPSATDGPFAETKEQLAGYYLVEARDLNEAIQLAGRIPGARVGSIEVRPIAESHLTSVNA
ncbi:MAG: YciI family protein [Longimicrobiales bacterium]